MLKRIPGLYILLLGNLIPFLHLGAVLTTLFVTAPWTAKICLVLVELYILPPLFSRFLFMVYGSPGGKYSLNDVGFKVWWLSSQLQALYLRFPFLEEILRIIPYCYSNWLRLWGAKIGKQIYWSPRVLILDRPHLEVGNGVVVGYGAGFTSHHFNKDGSFVELILATPTVEDGAVLGGMSGLGPGARVAKNETLPSTLPLAPFYEWREGRRFSLRNQKQNAEQVQ